MLPEIPEVEKEDDEQEKEAAQQLAATQLLTDRSGRPRDVEATVVKEKASMETLAAKAEKALVAYLGAEDDKIVSLCDGVISQEENCYSRSGILGTLTPTLTLTLTLTLILPLSLTLTLTLIKGPAIRSGDLG